jgi:hypothetical protein
MGKKKHPQSGSGGPGSQGGASTGPWGTGDQVAAPGFRDWRPHWQGFLRSHAAWWARFGAEQPVYSLPEAVIDALGERTPAAGEGHRERRPVITEEEREAERLFRKCCQTFSPSVVGVWHGQPVRYDLFSPPEVPSIPGERVRELRWDQFVKPDAVPAALEALTGKADGPRHQRLAYAGWLTFHEPYRGGLRALRARWQALGVTPLPWPLPASVGDQPATAVVAGSIDPARRLPEATASFLTDATALMRKWGLAGLVTWDLPLPQGPLECVPLGLATRVLGPDHAGTLVPCYYDTPSSQDLREERRWQQGRSAKGGGIGVEFPLTNLSPRAGRASEWENSYRLWFVEAAARQRYGGRPRLPTCLVAAFMRELGCSEDRVKQLRRVYKSLLTSSAPG